jgi:hypothetical protein
VRHQYDRAALVRARPQQRQALSAACASTLPVGSSASMSTALLTSARDREPLLAARRAARGRVGDVS